MDQNQSSESNLSWRDAIVAVLKTSSKPMHPTEIVAAISERGLRKVSGATPEATVGANIYSSMKRDGENSPFVKTDTGKFEFKQSSEAQISSPQPSGMVVPEDDESEPKKSAGIVHAFGMYWQRDLVIWKTNPQILGTPNKALANLTVVDFCKQRGVYFLHDGSEVVYVGRALERPLGMRLSEHTFDRLNGRWNRFSWFGFLKVSDGKLVEAGLKTSMSNASDIIVTMESLLIEGLEPKQNRKRGDSGFQAAEYIQSEDAIARERERKELILELLGSKGTH